MISKILQVLYCHHFQILRDSFCYLGLRLKYLAIVVGGISGVHGIKPHGGKPRWRFIFLSAYTFGPLYLGKISKI